MRSIVRISVVAALVAGVVGCGASGSAAPASEQPRVAVIGMGGTIAGVGDSRVAVEKYRPGGRSVSDMVGELQPEVGRIAQVDPEDFGGTGKASGDYTLADYYDLSTLIDQRLQTHSAVVVTSGTASMSELAYFLDLTVRSSKPVIVTGAMRPWTALGSDGPPNLYNAIRLAAGNRTACFGTVVTLNDQIFPARDVVKSDTLRLNTFTTREYGDLGTIDEAGVRLQRSPARARYCADPAKWATPFDLSIIEQSKLPRVEIMQGYVDAGGEAIDAAGVRGIVFAGTPAPRQAEAGKVAADKGITLVAANSYGAGAVYADFPGVISAGDLSPQKARILLQLASAESPDRNQISDWFRDLGNQQY
ncbi:asparaginase [Nocardia vulneris]|uniref:asparaginase n=1 Tax=Nocardia vulneris TaxID=1141657 RepID=UPI0030D4FB06